MKKFLGSLLVAAAILFQPLQAVAGDRITVYVSQNPDTNETNQQLRYQRLQDGTFLAALLGPALVASGAWSNLSIIAASGLNVTVNLANSNQLGMLYQVGPDDPTKVPASCPAGFGCNQLASDSTNIVIPAAITSNSSTLGPLNCTGCTSGQAIVYLIEGQVVTAAGNNQSMMFVSSTGQVTFPNVNTQINDTVSFQTKAGTAGSVPTPPTTDSGWTPIGYVKVVFGATQCSASCTIVMANGSNLSYSSFGQITFGGNFANNPFFSNSAGYQDVPSILTTSDSSGCGLSSAFGYQISNNGTNLLRGDASGDMAVCGPHITVTDVNSGTDVISPVQTNGTFASGSCTADSYCPNTVTICTNNSFYNYTAFVTLTGAGTWTVPPLYAITPVTPGTATAGSKLNVYNPTGSTASGTITYYATCL